MDAAPVPSEVNPRFGLWKQVLAVLPAVGMALMPKVVCPACWPPVRRSAFCARHWIHQFAVGLRRLFLRGDQVGRLGAAEARGEGLAQEVSRMLKSVTLEVVGNQKITCERCEDHIQRMLNAMPGVDQARAHSRNQRVEVLFDASALDVEAIAKRLCAAGYETRSGGIMSRIRTASLADLTAAFFVFMIATGAGGCGRQEPPRAVETQTLIPTAETKVVSIPVEGMSCGVCVASVKRAISAIDGVTGVEVSLKHREANIRYVPEKVSPRHLAAVINKLGYRAGEPKVEDAR